jgi:hypothetical protein
MQKIYLHIALVDFIQLIQRLDMEYKHYNHTDYSSYKY